MRAMAYWGDFWYNDTTWYVERQEWFKPVGTWRLIDSEVDASESPPVCWLLYVQDGCLGSEEQHWHKQTMHDWREFMFVSGRTCRSRNPYDSIEFWTRWRHREVDPAPPPQANAPMHVPLMTPMRAPAPGDELELVGKRDRVPSCS